MDIRESLSKTGTEREVEQIYNEVLKKYLKAKDISHPYECDGIIESKTKEGHDLKLLIEYKYDEDFKSAAGRAKVLIQAVYYLRQFEIHGERMPNVLLIADKNECFVLHTNSLHKYLNDDCDWSIAPSQAYMKNPQLMLRIAQDETLQTWVYNPDNESIRDVVKKIGELANNIIRKVHLCEENIEKVFDYFDINIWKDKSTSSHTLVGYFIGLLTNPDQYFIHPKNKNILCTPNKQITINGREYEKLFSHFDTELSPSDKRYIVSIADRLIEDSQRRRSGDFWTPKVWVDESHRRIEKELGEDWREKYVVWDNCCGGKNLTRDYKFAELYSSTLFQAELDMSMDYNPEGTAFQFDFLNDDLDKIPAGLKSALENDKPFVFFLNPPYKKAITGNKGAQDTNINISMKRDKIGRTVLSEQFIYRICKICDKYKLSNVYICIFCPTTIIRNDASKSIRKFFLERFDYINGYLINAAEFSNVSSSWGISFTQWKYSNNAHHRSTFPIDLMEIKDFEPIVTTRKILYNIDDRVSLTDWIYRTGKKYIKNQETLKLQIGLNPIDICKCSSNIGFFVKKGNKPSPRDRQQFICSGVNYGGVVPSHEITPANFEDVVCMFTAMTSPNRDWVCCDDEFMAPCESDPRFDQFKKDSVIFSLFKDSYSYQTSTDHDFNNRHWDINNEFFWMGKDEMLSLADASSNNDVYKDAIKDDERYVYKYIKAHWDEFSNDAKALYEAGCELVRKSFPYRNLYNEDHPEIQVNHWDAGWTQIKYILKEYMPDELKAFRKQFKSFESRMRPLVYELGFLRK